MNRVSVTISSKESGSEGSADQALQESLPDFEKTIDPSLQSKKKEKSGNHLFFTRKKLYVTTPIYYINASPHLGHAYTTVVADVFATWSKALGGQSLLATGTDEHGQKVYQSAAKEGFSSAQAYADHAYQAFFQLAQRLCYQDFLFIRTTDESHKKAVRHVWNQLKDKGYIYQGYYQGYYSVRDEAYYKESELMNGLAPTGSPVEFRQESCYFFKLSSFKERLKELYQNNPKMIYPMSRFNEVLGLLDADLPDLAVSRSKSQMAWGIEVPGDDQQVIYVWLDALTNYLSVLGYPEKDLSDPVSWWAHSLHLMGKDILKFHAIYWPAILMALDLPVFEKIIAHGWWLNHNGDKMSKSSGLVVDPFVLLNHYDRDFIRYFFMREASLGNDGFFSEELLQKRIQSELGNSWGNLLKRSLTLRCSLGSFAQEKKDILMKGYCKSLLNDDLVQNQCFAKSQKENALSLSDGDVVTAQRQTDNTMDHSGERADNMHHFYERLDNTMDHSGENVLKSFQQNQAQLTNQVHENLSKSYGQNQIDHALSNSSEQRQTCAIVSKLSQQQLGENSPNCLDSFCKEKLHQTCKRLDNSWSWFDGLRKEKIFKKILRESFAPQSLVEKNWSVFDLENDLNDFLIALPLLSQKAFSSFEVHWFLELLNEKVRQINVYLNQKEPWTHLKTLKNSHVPDKTLFFSTEAVLERVVILLRALFWALYPFMPSRSCKALLALGVSFEQFFFEDNDFYEQWFSWLTQPIDHQKLNQDFVFASLEKELLT